MLKLLRSVGLRSLTLLSSLPNLFAAMQVSLNRNFKYASPIIVLFLSNCKATNTEDLISSKTHISWGSLERQTSYQTSTQELGSNQIPDSVFKMTALTFLSVTGMDCDYGDTTTCWMIKEIPKQIENLYNLKSLILKVNNITKIPPGIKSLKHLRLLDLSDNPGLRDIKHVTSLQNLQNLFLYGCDLSKLPSDMRKLKNLKVLGLVGNNISKAEISQLKKELPDCEIIF